MIVDIKKQVEDAQSAVVPWDLRLLLNGTEYGVRPLKVADLASIRRFAEMSDEEGFAFLEGLFAGEVKPALRAWTADGTISTDELIAIVTAVSTYFEERTRKNSEAIASQLRKAMAKISI